MLAVPVALQGAGVTLITHGLNGNADGWVTGLATRLPYYSGFPGTNYSLYRMSFSLSNGNYYLTASRIGGTGPALTDSGEIILVLDWSQLADGNSYNTYQVGSAVAPALTSPNFIPELNGHALAEFPLHLVGHSRGGSLVCELSRQLGTNGLWIDHLTTLDPHPLNNDGFTMDFFLYSAVDAPARTYANVLFHDNYWQNIDWLVYGEPVSGAYVRELYNVGGGYQNTGDAYYEHSNVHLWYHGTLDPRNPATDTEASVTSTERNSWWSAYENSGAQAGFLYSLIGRGERTSSDQPLGPGYPAIREGYNQLWDLGAGQAANRTSLPANNGTWPNLIKFNLLSTNQIQPGASLSLKHCFQWAQPSTSTATISVYLDDDLNPYNSNDHLLLQTMLPASGSSSVGWQTLNVPTTTANAPAGNHVLYAKVTAGGKSRYLYAPEILTVLPSAPQPPPVLAVQLQANNVVCSWETNSAGFTLQSTTDFSLWSSDLPAPVVLGHSYFVTNATTSAYRFFRLKQ